MQICEKIINRKTEVNLKTQKQVLMIGLVICLISFLSISFFGCSKKEPDVLKIGGHTTIFGTVLEIGEEMGIFEKHGLNATVTPVRSSKESMAALAGGSMDVVLGTAAAGNLNLMANGNLFIIADAGSIIPQLVIRKDESKKIKSLEELKGKSVSVPREGSASWYAMYRILNSVNMEIADIDPKYLRQRETVAAFEAKNIDAAILSEPYTTIAVEKGIVSYYNVEEISKLFPDNGQQYGILLISDKMLNKPEVLKKFLSAYLESVKIYNRARNKQQPEFDDVSKIINDFTEVDIETIKNAQWPYVAIDGKPNIEYLEEMQKTFVELKLVPEPVDLSKVIKLEFLK